MSAKRRDPSPQCDLTAATIASRISGDAIEDPSAFRLLDLIGADRVMVETDYPHNDSSWPDSQVLVRGELQALDRDTITRICFGNAADLYGHPRPPTAVLEQSVIGRALLGRSRRGGERVESFVTGSGPAEGGVDRKGRR